MRSLRSAFTTLMLLIPVGSIPALAIFGIPQFAPVVVSPREEGHGQDREKRVGDSARHPSEELFADLDDFPRRQDDDSKQGGRMGDAVPIRRPDASREIAPRERVSADQLAQAPGRISSWAGDMSQGEFPKNTPYRGGASGGESFGGTNVIGADAASARQVAESPSELSSDGHSPLGRFVPESYRRGGSSAAISTPNSKSSPNVSTRSENIRQVAATESASAVPRGYQRQGQGLNRTTRPAAEFSENEAIKWQGAVRRLNELEIRNFRLDPGRQPGQFVFNCSYTPVETPRVSYRFEAEADEPLKAVEKVLVQIDEWRQRRQ